MIYCNDRGNSVFLSIYFDKVDEIYKAINEGASVIIPLDDVFWGDRYGQVKTHLVISGKSQLIKKIFQKIK